MSARMIELPASGRGGWPRRAFVWRPDVAGLVWRPRDLGTRGRAPRYDLLLALARLLDRLPRRRFHYGSWVGRGWGGAPDLSCGTTACALGWATTMPALRRRIFLRSFDPSGTETRVMLRGEAPDYSTDQSIRVGAAAFGVSWEVSSSIFLPSSSSSIVRDRRGWQLESPSSGAEPGTVARWIRLHVAAMRRLDRLLRRNAKEDGAPR